MIRPMILLLVLIALTGCGRKASEADAYLELHREAMVVDLHSDAVLRLMDGADFGVRDTVGHMDLPRLREGGLDLQVMVCWLATDTPLDECRPHVDEMIDSLDAQIARYSDQAEMCLTAAHAEEIVASGKIALFLGIENGVGIANDLENIDHFYNRGVRYMTLTHTASNDWCISSADTLPAFGGLTDFGRDVVRRMNEIGMIVDVSHASVAAVEEVLKVTTEPIIASHSCVHAICEHDRNLTDDQIKAIAANGGVIGINFFNAYLSTPWSEASDSLWETHRAETDSIRELYPDDRSLRWAAIRPIRNQIVEQLKAVGVDAGTVCDHIDHIVKLVGPDYVCFGSDYDGVYAMPNDLLDCSMVPNITKELVARGYSDEDIRKILGGNFMRLFRRVCDR